MLVNYFDKYVIDIANIEKKLQIIKTAETENASYINHVLKNAIEYLFEPVISKVERIYIGVPILQDKVEALVYFDTVIECDEISDFNLADKVFVIGNHESKVISEKIEVINIKEAKKIDRVLKGLTKVLIGVNIKSVDFSKYYYNRMRSYFLNVLDALDKVSINELENNIEKVCTDILMNEDNFNSKYTVDENKICFKQLLNVCSKLIGISKMSFCNCDIMSLDDREKFILNEIDLFIKVFELGNYKDRVSAVYDLICECMLEEADRLKYCCFIDDKCVASRYTKGFPKSKENGCCNNTYKDKKRNCRYLNENKSCSICSISCRVFTCAYLQSRGIDHSLKQYPVIDVLFGKVAKNRIIFSFFTPKDEMMKKL